MGREDSTIDDALVERAVSDAADARARLAELLFPVIWSMALARLSPAPGRWEDAEDVAQEALAASVTALPELRIRTGAGLRGLVSRIVDYKVADVLRNEARGEHAVGRAVSLDAARISRSSALNNLSQVLSGSERTPSSHVRQVEAFTILLEELGQLTDRYREAVTLAFFDHLNSTEIGERLGLQRTNAAMLVHRALTTLRERVVRRLDQA